MFTRKNQWIEYKFFDTNYHVGTAAISMLFVLCIVAV